MQHRDCSRWEIRLGRDAGACAATERGLEIEVRGWRRVALPVAAPCLARRLAERLPGGVAFAGLSAGLDPAGRDELCFLLGRLERLQLLEWPVLEGEGEIALLTSRSAGFHLDYAAATPEACRLSRFAYLRRDPEGARLESGAARALLRLQPKAAALVAAAGAALQPAAAHALYDLAWRAGLLDAEGEAEAEARQVWEFHDRLFHEVSRGLHEDTPAGGTYRLRDRLPPPPAVPALPAAPLLALPDPLDRPSRPLGEVMARRRSTRNYAAEPIGLEEISTLLHRVARTQEHLPGGPQELLRRAYPAGGSLHELQFHLAVARCAGLEPGLHRYDGERHGLLREEASSGQLDRLLQRSTYAMGQGADRPQVLLILTSRHARMAWKYQGMAYRASLMNLGVVLQTLYLVATDLGLAACANGAGASRIFEEASGLDSWEETAVGEFALGRAA